MLTVVILEHFHKLLPPFKTARNQSISSRFAPKVPICVLVYSPVNLESLKII